MAFAAGDATLPVYGQRDRSGRTTRRGLIIARIGNRAGLRLTLGLSGRMESPTFRKMNNSGNSHCDLGPHCPQTPLFSRVLA